MAPPHEHPQREGLDGISMLVRGPSTIPQHRLPYYDPSAFSMRVGAHGQNISHPSREKRPVLPSLPKAQMDPGLLKERMKAFSYHYRKPEKMANYHYASTDVIAKTSQSAEKYQDHKK